MRVRQGEITRYNEMVLIFNTRLNNTIPLHRKILRTLKTARFSFYIGQGWTGPNTAHTKKMLEQIQELISDNDQKSIAA